MFTRTLGARAYSASNAGDELASLRTACSLWRGPVLGGLRSQRLRDHDAKWLTDYLLALAERRFELELSFGGHDQLCAAELAGLAQQYPWRDGIQLLLLRALHRSGQRREALARFQTYARTLQVEHGLDPSPKLNSLHEEILKGEGI